MELLKDAILEHPQSPGFLIDGFPRELGQAKQFEDEVTLKTISTSYGSDFYGSIADTIAYNIIHWN